MDAEAADRLAIRELFDAYAHCADRRDAEGQKALFTVDTRFAVYMQGEKSEPTCVLQPFTLLIAQLAYEGDAGPELAYRFERFGTKKNGA